MTEKSIPGIDFWVMSIRVHLWLFYVVTLGVNCPTQQRVWETGKEASACMFEWVEKSVNSDLRQSVAAKVKGNVYKRLERPAVMFGLETVSLIKNQDSELKMLRFSLSDEDRQDNEWSHQGDGTGQTFIRKSLRGQIEMVWTSAEEGQ